MIIEKEYFDSEEVRKANAMNDKTMAPLRRIRLATTDSNKYYAKAVFVADKENIDLINIKCHDMKHKIRLLTNGKNFSNEERESIDKSITIYDSSLKTGNEALDVILTEKAFICNEKNVKFTCVIDGTLISFINETDIFSLFGNIMDNALNATLVTMNGNEL